MQIQSGLEKDSTATCFWFFKFHFWIFENTCTSKFWAPSYKNESNLLLVRIIVCAESFLPFGWRTFIWWKHPPKCCTILVDCWMLDSSNILLTSWNLLNNCCLPRFFGARFGGKDRGLCPFKLWSEQAGGLIHLFMKRFRTLKSFQIKTKIKNQKTCKDWLLF